MYCPFVWMFAEKDRPPNLRMQIVMDHIYLEDGTDGRVEDGASGIVVTQMQDTAISRDPDNA